MKEIQNKVKKTTKKLNLANTPELCCLDLMSEAGELAKEVLELTDYGKRKHIYNPDLARELGDAFYSLISLANIYDIDLEVQLNNSLRKYAEREKKRSANKQEIKVKLEPIVLAKNFLCLNSIGGCRNDCIYCYKHGWDIKNKFIPQRLYSPTDILNALKRHRYFHANIPLAIHNSATDPFQKGVTETTFEILDGLEAMKVTNIVALITKEYMSKAVIKRLEEYKHIRPVIFVSFSYLPKKYEKLVDERRLETMKNLSESNLKRILYYRPIIKGINDSETTVKKIIKLGEKYFDCIVRSSLKADINTIENMAKHGVYIDSQYDIGLNIHDSLKKMLPETRERVDNILKTARVPYFKKTSCAISWLFGQADYNTQWIRPEYYCSESCPQEQKKKCRRTAHTMPHKQEIDKLLTHLQLSVKYKINKDHVLLIGDDYYYSDIKFLRMALNFPVLVSTNKGKFTAEEYDRKYTNADRTEVRKLIKKMGIPNYSGI